MSFYWQLIPMGLLLAFLGVHKRNERIMGPYSLLVFAAILVGGTILWVTYLYSHLQWVP